MFINEVPNNDQLPTVIIHELRDIYGIKYRKEKKIKHQQMSCQQKIFGVSLKELEFTEEKLSNGSSCRIPIFVADACSRIMEHIEVEGLFRKAGSTVRQKEIREKLEKGIPLDDSCNVIDIANILKYFFRELPEPLLPTGNFQEAILRCLLCKGTQERKIAAIKMFLNLVSLHSTANKMSSKNLAIIFTPGLMPVHENYGQRLTSHVQIIEILIDNAHEIGVVPPEVMNRLPNTPDGTTTDPLNFTMFSGANSCQSIDSNLKIPETDIKKKKKRRSGSLTRMFNGFRKIVGAIGSSDNLDQSHEMDVLSTPCIVKTKKRKVLEASGFSSKKKKDVLSLMPSGGLLPSTPMVKENKPTKKSRLSLGGKRTSKIGAQPPSANNGPKSSIVSSLERRWSFMVPGTTSRQSINKQQPLEPIKDSWEKWESQISKDEYEEIKERVTAIETRISKEFTKLQSSIGNNSLDSMDIGDTRNGPERVLEKFEKTLEETEMMNTSPMTEQLAKRLSRGLKIRSSCENKIFRSPSARKIGSIRRRSQENARLTRTKTWHSGSNVSSPIPLTVRNTRATRNSPMAVDLTSPNIEKNVQIPRANLKRGRPNTFQNGLRSTQNDNSTKSTENPPSTFVVSEKRSNDEKMKKDALNDIQNEKWVCADLFFATPIATDEPTLNTSKNSTKSSATKPARKRLNMNIEGTPTNQRTISGNGNTPTTRSTNNASVAESTPMLPPRLPMIKKTPAKTPHPLANRSVFTPLWQQEQQQIAGRASIARLRSQNAGMVMAKAKLFDELVVEPVANVKKCQSGTQIRKSINNNRNVGDHDGKSELDNTIRNRLNESARKANDSPRRNRAAALNGVQRRHQLRAQRNTPTKKTPVALDKSLVNLNETSSRSGRHISSPAAATSTSAVQSPITRRMAAIDATPHSKRATMITKPPRRIIRTPQQTKRKPV